MGIDIENIDTGWKESWASKKTSAAFHNTDGGRMIISRRDKGEYKADMRLMAGT